jgi:hypothetical protein
MIGWVILVLGLSAPVALNLIVELWHLGENPRLPRPRWHPLLLHIAPMILIALGVWYLMGVNKLAVLAGLGAWGLSHLVKEILIILLTYRLKEATKKTP